MKENISATWKKFAGKPFVEQCSDLAFLCLCVFVLDVSVTGGGRFWVIGSMSVRMILALLAFVLCVPKFLKNFRRFITDPMLLMFGVFLIYLAISAVRGYFGDGRMNVLISDLKGFAWLFLVPVAMASVTGKKRFETLSTVILIGAMLQAMAVLAANIACTFVLESSRGMEDYFLSAQIGTIDRITATFYRFFMNSCPYMVTGCAIALFRQVRAGKIIWRYVLVIACLLCTLLLSFTRSIYGCVFVVAVCAIAAMIWFFRADMKKHLKLIGVAVAATCCLIVVLEFVFTANYFNFAVSRTFGTVLKDSVVVEFRENVDEWGQILAQKLAKPQDPSQPTDKKDMEEEKYFQEEYIGLTQESDTLRAETKQQLKELIRKNPIFGNGLGAYAKVRDSGLGHPKDGMDEYFYLDVLARMGVVGLVLYVLPFGYVLWFCFRRCNKLSNHPECIAYLCGMVGFWSVTWFNPWMNAALGITAYALCCTLPQMMQLSNTDNFN